MSSQTDVTRRPLRTAALRLRYVADDAVFFAGEPAAVWRSLLGRFLHRASSSASGRNELYSRLFKTPREAVNLPDRPPRILGPLGLTGAHVPHPFVLRVVPPKHRQPEVQLRPDQTTTWELVLVEDAVSHVPALCAAAEAIGQEGVGRKTPQPSGAQRRGRMQLQGASLHVGPVGLDLYQDGRWQLPPSIDETIYEQARALAPSDPDSPARSRAALTVRLQTPLRLKHEGAFVTPEALSPRALARACYRRWAGLALCYSPAPPTEETLDGCFQEADALAAQTAITDRKLKRVTRHRYSARQDRRIERTALLGRFMLRSTPERIAQWQRWLRRIEPLHLGKNTSMGYGWVSAEPADEPRT